LKLPPFEYRAPSSIDEALALLAEHGDDAKVLAGGQSLVPLLALRLARPAIVVDVGGIPEIATLDGTAGDDGMITIGAMVSERTAERSDVVRSRLPLLAEALPLVGHPAIRSRGTVGGSIAHGDPEREARGTRRPRVRVLRELLHHRRRGRRASHRGALPGPSGR
jgi:carbon-monoxide dehydrogenase medium subunit